MSPVQIRVFKFTFSRGQNEDDILFFLQIIRLTVISSYVLLVRTHLLTCPKSQISESFQIT